MRHPLRQVPLLEANIGNVLRVSRWGFLHVSALRGSVANPAVTNVDTHVSGAADNVSRLQGVHVPVERAGYCAECARGSGELTGYLVGTRLTDDNAVLVGGKLHGLAGTVHRPPAHEEECGHPTGAVVPVWPARTPVVGVVLLTARPFRVSDNR